MITSLLRRLGFGPGAQPAPRGHLLTVRVDPARGVSVAAHPVVMDTGISRAWMQGAHVVAVRDLDHAGVPIVAVAPAIGTAPAIRVEEPTVPVRVRGFLPRPPARGVGIRRHRRFGGRRWPVNAGGEVAAP